MRGKYPWRFVTYKIFCKINKPNWYLFWFRKDISSLKVFSENTFQLDLKTYDGLNQAVHPDVIFKDGKYYMAISPWPFMINKYENPCLFLSDDGINFSPLPNCQPLVFPRKSKKITYLSDPAVIYTDNLFCVYYREVEDIDGYQYYVRIYKVTSADLSSWSKPILLSEGKNEFLSPAVISRNGVLEIYYVASSSNREIYNLYRCQEIANTFTNHELLHINGMPEGFSLWHIGIFKHLNQLFGLMTLKNKSDEKDNFLRLYFAKGGNDGENWVITDEIRLIKNQESVFSSLYKSSIVINDKNECNLYVSGQIGFKGTIYIITNFRLDNYIQS